jgi:hypothetical protein
MSRGPSAAVYKEYAWGNTSIASAVYTLSSSQQAGEVIDTNYAADPVGNTSRSATDGGKDGPLRVGIFATASSTRAEAGASYYGVMEMSGNLRERAVTVGNTQGRSFTGSHGDGSLAASGNANTSGWPGTGATGTGNRGGHWNSAAEGLRVSNRGAAANTYAGRHSTYGFRLVNTLAQASGVTVTVDAPVEVTGGSDFIVPVNISCVEDFDAAVLRVRFDPAILSLTSVTDGNIGGTTIPIAALVEIESGLWGITANVPGFPGVTGEGYLMEFHFSALALGNSDIGLEHHSLSDKDAQLIPATWIDDSVTVV